MDEQTNTQQNNENKNSMYAPMIAIAALIILLIAGFALVATNKQKENTASVTPTVNSQINSNQNPEPSKSSLVFPSVTVVATPVITMQVSPVLSPVPSLTPSVTINTNKQFTVTGSNYKFDPNILTVKKGDTVKVIFNNTQGLHDFVIDEFNGAKTKQLQDGGSETISFVADKTGSFEFYCSVGQHRQMGMKGTLVVN